MANPEKRLSVTRAREVGGDWIGLQREDEEQKINKQKKINRRAERKVFNELNEKRLQAKLGESISSDLLKLHRRLHYLASHPLSELTVPRYHQYDRPYWEVPHHTQDEKILHTVVSPQLEVWSGPLSSFDLSLRALVVDMAMQVYAQELLKTQQLAELQIEKEGTVRTAKSFQDKVQRRKSFLEAQLLLAMCHSFRPDYVLGIAFATPNGSAGERHLVGSIGAVRGMSEEPIGLTVGMDGSESEGLLLSSLPTNAALFYMLNTLGRSLADTPESQFAEVTRLNVASKQLCERLGISERSQISQTLMLIIHKAVQENFPDVSWEIFNTQLTLHRVITMMGLPAEVISEEGSIRPSRTVAESIHGAYFQRTPPTPQVMRVNRAVEVAQRVLDFG